MLDKCAINRAEDSGCIAGLRNQGFLWYWKQLIQSLKISVSRLSQKPIIISNSWFPDSAIQITSNDNSKWDVFSMHVVLLL